MYDSNSPAAPTEEEHALFVAGLDPRAVRFLNAWLLSRNGRTLPTRQDFDPMRVPTLLPFTSLYRWDAERDDFVCKLAGEALRGAWGRSIAGLSLQEVVGPDNHPVIKERWQRILSGPMAHHGLTQERLQGEVAQADRLILPLRDGPDGPVDHIICFSLYRYDGTPGSTAPLAPEDITQIPCSVFTNIQQV